MDVEWMYGDLAEGGSRFSLGFDPKYNPLRWSGSLTFEKAIAEMEALRATSNNGNRPINVKIPSGVLTKKKECSDVDDAIKYIKSKSPAHIEGENARMNEEERKESLRKQFETAKEGVANYKKTLETHEKLEMDAKQKMDDAKVKMDEAVAEFSERWKELKNARENVEKGQQTFEVAEKHAQDAGVFSRLKAKEEERLTAAKAEEVARLKAKEEKRLTAAKAEEVARLKAKEEERLTAAKAEEVEDVARLKAKEEERLTAAKAEEVC